MRRVGAQNSGSAIKALSKPERQPPPSRPTASRARLRANEPPKEAAQQLVVEEGLLALGA